ncbi:MAG: hemerythrin domain-containing protein [Acidovorax sp.]|uniref:hemerythrin domain-containing protein n=1 Tax=Acidovorax sp. TaxID=1872122 RepID=UPI00391DFB31
MPAFNSPTVHHIPGFSAPAAGFDDPFAMLQACHERVQRTLALLARLRAHVLQHGADNNARQAARDVLRYFDIAAPLHHQDEELHVFPLLMAGASAEVQALVQRLRTDHAHMTADWAAARAPLQALVDWVPDGDVGDGGGLNPTVFSPDDSAALDRFAIRYADHMQAEEGVAYPAALQLLPPESLSAMGREMAARRGAR